MKYKIESLGEKNRFWPVDGFACMGSESNCQIVTESDDVEAKHARLEVRGAQLYVKDLRSRTGTLVNGAQILEAMLRDGDILNLGGQEFMVHDDDKKLQEFALKSRNEHWNMQLQTLSSVALSAHPVLLLGPSGAGKDVIAQALHKSSLQAAFPFLSVNCSALTETLVESELFGHVKGSFTGATSDRKGAFETARNGTLFLDEIGDLPYGLQAKLLRALENNEIHPVGSDRNIKTNVRIIAATHQNLYQKIREGAFRSDLFYRLNVISIEVPSLKERIEDFDDLIYQFARQMKVRFSVEALNLLKKHDWHGNIRELKNVVARASALFPKQSIEIRHVDILLNKKERFTQPFAGTNYAGGSATMPVIKEIEKQMILKRLAANHGNQKRTAVDLGMPKSTLHDRIKNYSINTEDFKG